MRLFTKDVSLGEGEEEKTNEDKFQGRGERRVRSFPYK
jgi:hypothetical protein